MGKRRDHVVLGEVKRGKHPRKIRIMHNKTPDMGREKLPNKSTRYADGEFGDCKTRIHTIKMFGFCVHGVNETVNQIR